MILACITGMSVSEGEEENKEEDCSKEGLEVHNKRLHYSNTNRSDKKEDAVQS